MRVYWPWWLFPVAFCVWFVGAMMRLAAWPFQALARRDDARRDRTTIRIVVRDAEKPEG